MFDHNAAARVPIDFNISGEVDLHIHSAVSVLREKAQNLASRHQFARCLEDNADAEVAFVARDFDAEEVKNWRVFGTQRKYT